jgi:hypothetical protein
MTNAAIGQAVGQTAKTKRVRVLLIMDHHGTYEAMGASGVADEEIADNLCHSATILVGAPWSYQWIEADVPIPEKQPETVIEGDVVSYGGAP